MKAVKFLKEYSVITLGTFIAAAAVFFFLVPSNLAIGSISGLAIIVNHFLPINVSYITMAMNVFLLIMGLILVGPEFGVKTIYTSLIFPVFLWILEVIFPNFESMTGEPFLDMICYCLVVSVGMALLFVRNASSGGLDIVAKILNKFFRIDLGKALSISGIVIAMLSAICYDKKIVVVSLIGTYLGGIVLDNFIFGINEKKQVCIISEKFEEIRRFVVEEMQSGASIYNVKGAYGEMAEHKELQVIVTKQEYSRLMKYLETNDPTAFVTVYTVNTVSYVPKKKVKK